jgi:hypothetical protein
MSVYTVHEPPLRAAEIITDPERFVFVRDGVSIWAFLFSWLWMLWHRMWLVLLIYVVVAAGLETVLHYAGASSVVIGVVAFLLSLLVGVEASTLRRFTLARRGWKNVGVVSGHRLEEVERRFFDAWVRGNQARRGPSAPPPIPPSPSAPRQPQSHDVIGLFPEPGVSP